MNGTINLKKLSTKILDAISTLNTDVSNLTTSIPSQIKTNNQRTLATVEQNPNAASRAYVIGEYLVANGKLYKVLNNIAEGAALQDNVNIEWVLLGDEVSKLRGDLKAAAYSEVINGWDRQTAGGVLDARLGPTIKMKMDLADSLKSGLTYVDYTVTTGKEQYQGFYYVDIDVASNRGTVVGVYVQHVDSNRPAFSLQIGNTRIRAFTTVANISCILRVLFKNY